MVVDRARNRNYDSLQREHARVNFEALLKQEELKLLNIGIQAPARLSTLPRFKEVYPRVESKLDADLRQK
jgi:hypothetical protein